MTTRYLYTLSLLVLLALTGCDATQPEPQQDALTPAAYAELIAPQLFTFSAEESGLGTKTTVYASSRKEARSILDRRIAEGLTLPDFDGLLDYESVEDLKKGISTIQGIGTPFWMTEEYGTNHTFAMEIAVDGRTARPDSRYTTEAITHHIAQDAFNISCETIFMIIPTRNAAEIIALTQFDVGVYFGHPTVVWNFQVNGVEQYGFPAWTSTALLPPYYFF